MAKQVQHVPLVPVVLSAMSQHCGRLLPNRGCCESRMETVTLVSDPVAVQGLPDHDRSWGVPEPHLDPSSTHPSTDLSLDPKSWQVSVKVSKSQ